MFGFSPMIIVLVLVIIGAALIKKKGYNKKTTKSNLNVNQRMLVALLFNRVSNVEPEFIGRFNGVSELPKKEYPPVYYWINKSIKDFPIVMSHNTPLLRKICHEEIMKNNLKNKINSNDIESAIKTYIEISTNSFISVIQDKFTRKVN